MADTNNDWIEAGGGGEGTAWDGQGTVQGVYTGKKSGVGPNKSMLYSLRNTDGEIVSVWGSTVIDSKFETIPTGAEVRVESLGLATGKTGKQYKDYKIQYRLPSTEANAVNEVMPGATDVDDSDEIL